MKKNLFKSIGAIVAGFVFIGVTHTGTDAIFESVGVLPKGNLFVGTGLILFVISYRAFFSFIGCCLTARLAPKNPMNHSLILGTLGTVLSTAGAIASTNMNLGPAWYAWSLVVMSLPIAWFAGRLVNKKIY